MDDLSYLNSLSARNNPPSSSTAPLATLPLDHPLYSTLAPLLATIQNSSGDETLDESAVEELLKQMEESETAIEGLDSKLDSLLSTLDGLLGSLSAEKAKAGSQKVDEKKVEKSG